MQYPRLVSHAACWCSVMLALAPIAQASAQSLGLTPSGVGAGSIGGPGSAAPTQAHYQSGTSAPTPGWTLTVSCPNSIGNASNYCVVRGALADGSPGALGIVRVQFTLSGSSCRTPTGPYTRTVSSTGAIDLFEVTRVNAPVACTATAMTFTVTDLSYTKYPSDITAKTYTQGIVFTTVVR